MRNVVKVAAGRLPFLHVGSNGTGCREERSDLSEDLSVPGDISPFERIRRTNASGAEFWSSRDFAVALDYSDYRNFEQVVGKARLACFNSGHRIEDHFVDVTGMVTTGSVAERPVKTILSCQGERAEMSRFAPVYTPSLILREFVIGDAPKVFQMSLESGMRRWLPDQVHRSEDHTTEVLEYLMEQYDDLESPARAPCVLGVCVRNTGELVGHVGLSPLRDQVEIGYAIEERRQGNGYATEAVSAMTQWGHDIFGMLSVLGVVAGANVGSCRVLEKSGFLLAKEETGVLHGWQGLVRTYLKEFLDLKEQA